MVSPEKAAICLAGQAYRMSKSKDYSSPFAEGAIKAGLYYHGGKEDDITVVVT